MSAGEYLAELANSAPAQRWASVSALMQKVFDAPRLLVTEIDPGDVIAAAAVVVASLPGGRWLGRQDLSVFAAGLPRPATQELAALTLAALDVVTGRDRDSVPVRLDVTDGAAASRLIEEMRKVLVDGVRGFAPIPEEVEGSRWDQSLPSV